MVNAYLWNMFNVLRDPFPLLLLSLEPQKQMSVCCLKACMLKCIVQVAPTFWHHGTPKVRRTASELKKWDHPGSTRTQRYIVTQWATSMFNTACEYDTLKQIVVFRVGLFAYFLVRTGKWLEFYRHHEVTDGGDAITCCSYSSFCKHKRYNMSFNEFQRCWMMDRVATSPSSKSFCWAKLTGCRL